MAKNTYARYKFVVRKGQLMCIGQKRTMRGTIYDKNRVWVDLEDRSARALKTAMAIGIVDLNEGE